MLTRRLILLKRTAAPQMSECMAKPDKQFAGPASPYAHAHFHFTKHVNSHDTLNFPHLQVKRGRGSDRNYRKKREKERKEESRNKWKTASPRSARLLWKRGFALTNFNQVAGSQRCQPHGSEGNAPWPSGRQWWQSWWVCKNLWWPFKRFLKLLNLQSSPITHVQDNTELN